MNDLSWAAIVRLVHARAHDCCEYCQTCRDVIGQSMHVDHIDPNGSDQPDNLCLACPNYNLIKSNAIAAPGPETASRSPYSTREPNDGGIILCGKTMGGASWASPRPVVPPSNDYG